MPTPRVSVVVPFRDRQRHLRACVEALVAQEDIGGAVEIILVDNGSADQGAAIAASYPDVMLVHEGRAGAYPARNAALRHVRAPIVAFTDADCVVARDWLRAVCDGMADPGVGMVVGACRYPPNASSGLAVLAAYENAKADYVINRCPPPYHFAYANNMAVRTALFAELGPFVEWARAGDTELVQRMARRRPDLRLAFNPSMRITHLEFLRLRDRLRRLSLYTQTNARIGSFRELGTARRLAVLLHLLRGRSAVPDRRRSRP